jgi:serine/threonine protein phosphatase PrpC
LKLAWASSTDKGRVRRINQDSIYADGKLFAVADGMGGHAGGEVASKLAVDTISELSSDSGALEGFRASFLEANRRILSEASHSQTLKGMGTTLTAALLVKEDGLEYFLVQNVGDSRVYLFHRGELQQITRDHTFVGELLRSGSITEEQAAHHSQRHVLTKALGVEPVVDADVFKVMPTEGDILLLCSDGLINHVKDAEIESILSGSNTLQEKADQLIESANLSGGTDNISVVLVEVVALEVDKSDNPATELGVAPDESTGRSLIKRGPELLSIPRPLDRHATRRGGGVITVRVALFLLLFVLLVGGVLFAVQLYEDHSYFVGESHGSVAIFHGHPGGLLWYSPAVVRVSSLRVDQLNVVEASAIKDTVLEPSLSAADNYVKNLEARIREQHYIAAHPLGGSESSITTTTTVSGSGVG